MTTGFRRLLLDLVKTYGGTKQDLAKAIGITPSALSHLLAHPTGTASTEVCLRLAAVTGTSASRVLRAAGKSAIADLLEDLYGEAAIRRQPFTGFRLKPSEERTWTALRSLDPRCQRAFVYLIDQAAASPSSAAAIADTWARR